MSETFRKQLARKTLYEPTTPADWTEGAPDDAAEGLDKLAARESGGGNLGELDDVTLDTPADNEVLAKDSTSGHFINQTAAEAGLAAADHDADHVTGGSDKIRDATAAQDGLATAAQIAKLGGIEAGANDYSHPNHTGDVTSVADGAQTIANDAVTNAKAANMAQATVKGRASGAGTGDPTDLTATQARTILNVEDGADVTDTDNVDAAGAVMESDSVDVISDIDTTTDPPALNECLKWNGAKWVPAAYDYTFVFSIATFTDNEASTQLIGSGAWEATGNLIFNATYNNGPPTAATITMTTNGGGGVWGTNPLVMDSPYAQKATTEATNYPTSKDTYISFTLSADKGAENDIDGETVYFRNLITWGSHANGSSLTEAQVEGLTGGSEAISNDTTRSMALSSVGTNYLVFAHPATYTTIKVGSDYETDGHTGFTYNGIAIAMTLDSSTLSITNSAGFTENYKVYVSDLASLGDHTLVSSSGNATIDPLYYGKTVKTDTFLEADIEGLANSEVTNDNTQVWDAVTTGSGEYMLFAFPKRLGIPTFWVGGFEGGFEDPETVSVTNVNGYTEDYYAWRSTNSNLGATVVETK